MAVSPDYAANLTKSLVELFADAETRILALIAQRVAVGLDAPDWQLRQIAEAHRLRGELQKLIRALRDGSQDEIRKAIDAAYTYGAARAGSELKAAGAAEGIAFGPINLDALTNVVDQAKAALGSSLLPIQSSAQRIYADVVQQTAARMLAGVGTRRQAAAMALQDWARRGVTGFTDSAGRNWSLPTYAEATSRTAAAQALNAGTVDRFVETGHDLGMVSDAPEECRVCRPWEGKIVSLTGQTAPGTYRANGATYTVTASLQDAIADGLHHVNCRHREVLYLPGVTRRMTDTADPEGDQLRQKQRAMERRVRQLKREAAVTDEIDPAAGKAARSKLRAYQASFADWREANGRKTLGYRTSLTNR